MVKIIASARLLFLTGYKLQSTLGIELVTEAHLVSKIGDIGRFPDSDKLAQFMDLRLCRLARLVWVKTKGVGKEIGY